MARKKGSTSDYSWRMKQFIKHPYASRLRRDRICREETLSEDFMRQYKDFLNWTELSLRQEMSEEFIYEMKDKVDWRHILNRSLLSETWLRNHADEINWKSLSSSNQTLSNEFLREFQDKIEWDRFSYYRRGFDNKFVEEFAQKLEWCGMARKAKMSERCIRQHMFEMRNSYSFWSDISEYQTLSEQFMEDFANHINWRLCSIHQKMSESFIEKWKNKVDWRFVTTNNVLSEEFIDKHVKDFSNDFGYVFWSRMLKQQKLSRKFMRKYKKKIKWCDVRDSLLHGEIFNSNLNMKFVDKMLEEENVRLEKERKNYYFRYK